MPSSNSNYTGKQLNLMACVTAHESLGHGTMYQTVEWIIYDIHKKLHNMLSRHVNTMYEGNHWKQIKPNFDETIMFRI